MENKHQKSSNLYYYVKGEGIPVVLLHGIAASLHDWDALAPDLVNCGYKAIALDLLGHGNSLKPSDPQFYTSKHIYDSFEKWMKSLDLCDSMFFIGHSLGGFISLQYAINHPSDVRGIVLIDPYYRSDQLSPILKILNKKPHLSEKAIRHTPLWLIDWMLGWDPIKTEQFSTEARFQIAYDYKRAAPFIMYIPGTLPDITGDLPNITTPVKIIWGEKDQTLEPHTFQELVNVLPNASGMKIKKAGHQPHIGCPDKVNPEILEFLAHI